MSVKSNNIFGRLANQFTNSNTLFFNSQLSAEAIHKACHALGHRSRERIYSPATTLWMFIGREWLPKATYAEEAQPLIEMAAKIRRGASSIGDLLIPLLIRLGVCIGEDPEVKSNTSEA
jgi:hypothetical protein